MKRQSMFGRILFLTFLLCSAAIFVHAQEDTASREITSLDFQNQRQKPFSGQAAVKVTLPKNATPKQKKNIAVITNAKRRYNLVKRIPSQAKVVVKVDPNNPKQKIVLKSEQLGITFWRLRPIAADDGDVPIFSVKVGDGRANWTAERVNSTTRFKIGDRVRFTIESSRSGYLYIVNRELYADGTAGQAEIIFPTLRTRGGDNRVVAGSLIEVPDSTDSVPYFTIKPRRADYAGEEIAVLIVKEKLPFEIGMKPIAINLTQYDKWFEDWAATVDIYDAADGEGIAITNNEALAANSTSRSLEQEEPLPQTIYKVQISSDLPLLVPFRMAILP